MRGTANPCFPLFPKIFFPKVLSERTSESHPCPLFSVRAGGAGSHLVRASARSVSPGLDTQAERAAPQGFVASCRGFLANALLTLHLQGALIQPCKGLLPGGCPQTLRGEAASPSGGTELGEA